MLKQATMTQIRSGELTRKNGHIVIVMRHYPRGLAKKFIDEYLSQLAPDLALFREFKKFEKLIGHNQAFKKIRYTERFVISDLGWNHLERLANLSQAKNVYFVCQCKMGDFCHREILMLWAHARFNAQIEAVFHQYRDLEGPKKKVS